MKTHSVPKMRDALDASGQRTLWGLFKELLTTILATLHFCMKIIQQLHSGLELMGGDDSLAVFRLSGDSLHVALGLYLCVQQQQFCVASLG